MLKLIPLCGPISNSDESSGNLLAVLDILEVDDVNIHLKIWMHSINFNLADTKYQKIFIQLQFSQNIVLEIV